MNRSLQIVNFIGVAALAALCVFQWRANRALNLEVNALLKTRMEQVTELENRGKALDGCQRDLENFRESLMRVAADLKQAEGRLTEAEREGVQLTGERDQLRASVTNWAAAVEARDEQLKRMDTQLRALADDRNEAVLKFNELAEKYNVVVKDLNDRTRQFNELAERVKAASKE